MHVSWAHLEERGALSCLFLHVRVTRASPRRCLCCQHPHLLCAQCQAGVSLGSRSGGVGAGAWPGCVLVGQTIHASGLVGCGSAHAYTRQQAPTARTKAYVDGQVVRKADLPGKPVKQLWPRETDNRAGLGSGKLGMLRPAQSRPQAKKESLNTPRSQERALPAS